jgi:Holliday junction DNA helicase RuvB
VQLDEPAATEIARRSRGTPRIANRLLRRVRDYAQVHRQTQVEAALVGKALELEGVDTVGLDDLDRRYLRTLINQERATGVATLAAAMQQEADTLEEVVEPYLLYEGFIVRTSGGRLATPKGYLHLGLRPPGRPSAQQPLPLEDDED